MRNGPAIVLYLETSKSVKKSQLGLWDWKTEVTKIFE